MPTVFGYSVPEFSAACGSTMEDDSDEEQEGVDGEGGGSPRVNGTEGGVNPGHLRKKLLKTAREEGKMDEDVAPTDNGEGASHERAKGKSSEPLLAPPRAKDVWIREILPDNAEEIVWDTHVKNRPFFCNSTLYTLLRLIQVRPSPSFPLSRRILTVYLGGYNS